jgi:hypothetical protein
MMKLKYPIHWTPLHMLQSSLFYNYTNYVNLTTVKLTRHYHDYKSGLQITVFLDKPTTALTEIKQFQNWQQETGQLELYMKFSGQKIIVKWAWAVTLLYKQLNVFLSSVKLLDLQTLCHTVTSDSISRKIKYPL